MYNKLLTTLRGLSGKARFLPVAAFLSASALGLSAQTGPVEIQKLSGTVIGSQYSLSGNSPSTSLHTKADAFDGDVATYFAAYDQSMGWAGLDLGTPHVITAVAAHPRANSMGPRNMLLGLFEGANSPDFMDAVPLYLIDTAPTASVMNEYPVSVSRGFRYVRYVGPASSHSYVAELEFYGYESEGTDEKFYQVTDIPTVSIHIEDNGIPTNKGEDFSGRVTITYEHGTLIQEYPILARVRGNFSATHENKPYRIKFNDGKSHHMLKGSLNDESPAKAKKWTLINSYGDKTLIRNNIAYEVSRRMGMPYTPYCRAVDLLLNGEYRGTYQLTDWLGVDKARINIDEMAEGNIDGEELTGGYFFEMNGYAGSDPVHFTSQHGNPVTVHSPEDDVIQDVQFDYLVNHFNKMENAVYSSGFTDPEKGYRSLLDLDSFLKYFLSNEFSNNTDMLWQVFMYKQRGDDHIFTGPVWDNDLALENDFNYYPANEQKDWTYKVRGAGNWRDLVTRVLSDPSAMDRLREIWGEVRVTEAFTVENIQAYVDSLSSLVAPSARLNHIRWPYLLQKIHCNPVVWGSWDAEIENVRNFVGGRVTWMDNKLRYNQLERKNGYYQISSGLDMAIFSSLVAGGEYTAKAELTRDLDMSSYSARYVPIGSYGRPYRGIFKGNRHVIRNLNVTGTNRVALFGALGAGAEIHDITIDSTCSFRGKDYVAALAAYSTTSGVLISGCGNEALITGESYVGGLVGYCLSRSLEVRNCYNTGRIAGVSSTAALIGSITQPAAFSYCYNSGVVTGASSGEEFVGGTASHSFTECHDLASDQVETLNPDDLTSGALCYRLNEAQDSVVWYQNIDNGENLDAYPVLRKGHGVVVYDEDAYTNIIPGVPSYRYFMIDISALQGDNTLQFAEFVLLDDTGAEIKQATAYSGAEGSISHENWPYGADGQLNTKYCTYFNGRAWLMVDAGREVPISGYRIYTANDTDDHSGRNPSAWRVCGSAQPLTDPDATAWQLLDERINDFTLGATSYQPYDFMVAKTVTSLELSTNLAYLAVGETAVLKTTIYPAVLQNTLLRWTSSDEHVVKVDAEGRLTAVALGEATVTVVPVAGGARAACHVVVTDQPMGYRYYRLEVVENHGGGLLQFSEFDLEVAGVALSALKIYSGPSRYQSGESWSRLCDDRTDTKFCGTFSNTALNFYFDAGSQVKPSTYVITTAGDASTASDRNPRTWRLWGSPVKSVNPNGNTWVLLDERSGDDLIPARDVTPCPFEIDWLTVTGVDEVKAPEAGKTGVIYDLTGRRVERMSKGIYVIDGRKVLVK